MDNNDGEDKGRQVGKKIGMVSSAHEIMCNFNAILKNSICNEAVVLRLCEREDPPVTLGERHCHPTQGLDVPEGEQVAGCSALSW